MRLLGTAHAIRARAHAAFKAVKETSPARRVLATLAKVIAISQWARSELPLLPAIKNKEALLLR